MKLKTNQEVLDLALGTDVNAVTDYIDQLHEEIKRLESTNDNLDYLYRTTQTNYNDLKTRFDGLAYIVRGASHLVDDDDD
jgi:predicted nuclease with TOPRIM domain